jgi:hypothetical protein
MDRAMKRFIRTFAKVAITIVCVVVFIAWFDSGWWPIPSIHGHLDAMYDVAHGHYKELGYGHPFRGANQYAQLLKARYRIEFYYVGFCTASASTRSYADAYDEVSMAAAKRKFGHDIFRETSDEVVKAEHINAKTGSVN